MTYMIERRYGRCNRDWLLDFDKKDGISIWMLGAHRAKIFKERWEADLALSVIIEEAKKWDNGSHFTFAVIEDRRHLPSYFASQDAA